MIGLYRASRTACTTTSRRRRASACASRNTLGFGCTFVDADLDGLLDLVVANGHIDETVRNIRGNVGYAQAPQLFLNERRRKISRRGERSRRRFRHAEGRPRPRLRRLRQRRRRGSLADDESTGQRLCIATIKLPGIAACGCGWSERNRIATRSARWCTVHDGGSRSRASCAAGRAICRNRSCR